MQKWLFLLEDMFGISRMSCGTRGMFSSLLASWEFPGEDSFTIFPNFVRLSWFLTLGFSTSRTGIRKNAETIRAITRPQRPECRLLTARGCITNIETPTTGNIGFSLLTTEVCEPSRCLKSSSWRWLRIGGGPALLRGLDRMFGPGISSTKTR